jgi:hypothetical protein
MRQCATTFHVHRKHAFFLVHFSLQYHWLTWLIYLDLIRDEQMRCSQCWNASWLHVMMFLNRFICSSVCLVSLSRNSSSSCLPVTANHYSKSLKKGFQLAYWLLVGGLYVHHVNSLCVCPLVRTAQASAWLVLAVPCWTAGNLILATRNTGKPSIDLVLLGSFQGSMWRQLSTRTSASQSGMWEVRTRYLHC